MAAIRWTVGAREDLRAIVEYIARDSPMHAAATADRIVKATERLRRHPRLGREVPEYHNPALRELVVLSYRVVYRFEGAAVGIVAIVHGSRDLLKHLSGEAWSLE